MGWRVHRYIVQRWSGNRTDEPRYQDACGQGCVEPADGTLDALEREVQRRRPFAEGFHSVFPAEKDEEERGRGCVTDALEEEKHKLEDEMAVLVEMTQNERLANFLKALKARDGTISEFDGSLWGEHGRVCHGRQE